MPFRHLPAFPLSRLIVLWFAFQLLLLIFGAFVSPLSVIDYEQLGLLFLALIATVHALFCVFLLRELWLIAGGNGTYVKISAEEREDIQRSKEEFMTMAAHQLRTPLASLRWNLELIAQEPKKLSPEQRNSLKEAFESADSMQHIINELLDAARIELQAFFPEKKPLRLEDLVQSVLDGDLKVLIAHNKLTVSLDIERDASAIEGDERLCLLLLRNLLDNAVKYTPKKGAIAIAACAVPEGVQVRVSNSGSSISLQKQMTLFQKPLPSRRMQYAGEAHQGLGLYIVKSIAERLGWKIWFELGEKRGVTFFVLIPAAGRK